MSGKVTNENPSNIVGEQCLTNGAYAEAELAGLTRMSIAPEEKAPDALYIKPQPRVISQTNTTNCGKYLARQTILDRYPKDDGSEHPGKNGIAFGVQLTFDFASGAMAVGPVLTTVTPLGDIDVVNRAAVMFKIK